MTDEQETTSESTLAAQEKFKTLIREADEVFSGENPEAKLETSLPFELAQFVKGMKEKGILRTTLEPLISEDDVPTGVQAASVLLLKEGHNGALEFLQEHSEDEGTEGGNARFMLMAWENIREKTATQEDGESIDK